MIKEDVAELFQPYMEEIEDVYLNELAMEMFRKLPDYFFTKPASSTGKYHPKFAQGDGGLVRHTIYAIEVWKYLWKGFARMFYRSNKVYEAGIIALMFHDCYKYGNNEQYTTKTHAEDGATVMSAMILSIKLRHESEIPDDFEQFCNDYIVEPMKHHMGPWSTYGLGSTLMEQLVFIADYVASQPTFEKEIFKCENN